MSKISIYTTLYLVNKNKFDFWKKSILNFAAFGDEVVIGTTEEGCVDGTYYDIVQFLIDNKLENVTLSKTDKISFSDNRFDGKIKQFALEKTTYPIKIQMDADEKFVLSLKDGWLNFIEYFERSQAEVVLIPSIDLWGDEKYVRKNVHYGYKFRLHKEGIRRGVLPSAVLDNGLLDTSQTDTTEVLREDGSLPLIAREGFGLYTLHYGFVDFKYRENINKNWWKQKWEDRSGKEENVVIDAGELEREEVIEHGLDLE